jgi:hypothetical protein
MSSRDNFDSTADPTSSDGRENRICTNLIVLDKGFVFLCDSSVKMCGCASQLELQGGKGERKLLNCVEQLRLDYEQ